MEGSRKWGQLGWERKLLRLLRLLVLLVRRMWRSNLEDVVAILLRLLLGLGVRRSFGCVWGVCRAFVGLVVMRVGVVLVGRLW